MKRLIAILAAIMMMTVAVSCGSAGKNGGQNDAKAPAKQEESVEPEASAEQEEAPVEEEASSEQEEEATAEQGTAAAALEAAADGTAVAAQEAATEVAATTAQEAAAEEAAFATEEASQEQEDMYAEAVKSLFGAGGPLFGVLPEGTNIDEMVGTSREQMGQADQEIRQVLDEVAENAQNDSIDPNVQQDTLEEYAEALLERILGSADFEKDDPLPFASLDEYLEVYDGIKNLEDDYIRERNAESMEAGDVQIVASNSLADEEIDEDQARRLACVIQNNYRMDEENQLRLVSSSEDVVLFTHQKDQDGNYLVTDAEFAEKGENYDSSIQALNLKMDDPSDELQEDLEASRIMVAYDLKEYLEEHPEVKGIEFEGEIRTAEELDEIMIDRLSKLYEED
jgi:ribosomal protein L22